MFLRFLWYKFFFSFILCMYMVFSIGIWIFTHYINCHGPSQRIPCGVPNIIRERLYEGMPLSITSFPLFGVSFCLVLPQIAFHIDYCFSFPLLLMSIISFFSTLHRHSTLGCNMLLLMCQIELLKPTLKFLKLKSVQQHYVWCFKSWIGTFGARMLVRIQKEGWMCSATE